MGQGLGKPLSLAVEGFVNGKRFVKQKVLVPISEPLSDHLRMKNKKLGQLKVLCSYENVSRICRFCGKIRHVMSGCSEY